jgi:hypothetical protein
MAEERPPCRNRREGAVCLLWQEIFFSFLFLYTLSAQRRNHIGCIGHGKPFETRTAISAPEFVDDARTHFRRDLGRAILLSIDNQGLGNEIGREIGESATDGRRLVARRNDDRHSHWTLAHHHHAEDGRRCASHASMPHALPARPAASPREASTGTSSSQIHAVPHSDTKGLQGTRTPQKRPGA